MIQPSREQVFFEVFKELHFPFFAIDLYALGKGLTAHNPGGLSHFGLRLPDLKDRRTSVAQAFRAVFKGIDPPPAFDAHFAQSRIINDVFGCRHALEKMGAQTNTAFAIYERDGFVMWEEGTAWPLGYSTFLRQLSTLFEVYRRLIEESRKDQEDQTGQPADILDQTSRVLPTRFHYAMASLGAWAGGTVNLQFFSYYATDPQRRDPIANQKYGKIIGYSETDAKELTDGGLIVVPASLASNLAKAQGSEHLTGIGMNEMSASNPPKKWLQATDTLGASLAGFIIDKYYRASFFAPPLEDYALYGKDNVLRDHYTEFYRSVSPVGLLRVKHYCIPIVEVGSLEEMQKIVGGIPARGEGKLFFRGQGSLYALPRPPRIKQLLFGESCATEPSLSTAAARNSFDYDTLHFALRYFIQERILGQPKDLNEASKIYETWLEQVTSPMCALDYAIMALAQHYGIPTHGLDVTMDLDVATWFATNRFNKKDGRCSYHVTKLGCVPIKLSIVSCGTPDIASLATSPEVVWAQDSSWPLRSGIFSYPRFNAPGRLARREAENGLSLQVATPFLHPARPTRRLTAAQRVGRAGRMTASVDSLATVAPPRFCRW